MNAFRLLFSLSIVTACGGDFKRDGADDTAADTGAGIDIDTVDTDFANEISERGYGWDSNSGIFYLASWANIYGQSLGMYCDGCRSEMGWSDAVAIATYDEGLDAYRVPLMSFGTGVSLRFGFATMDEDGHPDRWIDLSEIARRDPYNFVVEVQECGVRKHNFCVEIASNGGLVQGECALTYEPPEGCDEDGDGGGDTDPDSSDGEDDDGDGGGDTDDGGDTGSGSSDLTREVCVEGVSGDFDLGYLLMNDSSDTANWVSDNGSTAVVRSPLITESDSDWCATIELNSSGEQVKFNGWAENSTYWHDYFVGTGTSGYCSGTTCAVGRIYVDSTVDGEINSDAELATVFGGDLAWTD